MQTTSRVVCVFNPRDAVPPMIPDQFRPSLYERLHLFLLHVLVYLLLGLVSLSQPLARCLQLGFVLLLLGLGGDGADTRRY